MRFHKFVNYSSVRQPPQAIGRRTVLTQSPLVRAITRLGNFQIRDYLLEDPTGEYLKGISNEYN
jgi:hypothetical protein